MASGQEYNLADKKSAWKTVVFIFHTILMSVILQIRPQHLFTPPPYLFVWKGKHGGICKIGINIGIIVKTSIVRHGGV